MSFRLKCLFVAFCLFLQKGVFAADIHWGTATSGQVTNNANWNGGVAPTAGDSAYFTNKITTTLGWDGYTTTNANAYFNMPGNGGTGVYTLGITNGIWWLTNSFIVGQTLGSTAIVTHTVGTILVTNSSGTANLTVGLNGKGTFNLNGGTVIADTFYVTNDASGEPSSAITLTKGSLTILHGMIDTNGNTLAIGNVNSGTMTVNILGGTSVFGSQQIFFGDAGTAFVSIVGPSTVFSNSSAVSMGLTDGIGGHRLIISNGASVNLATLNLGEQSSSSNLVLVSDSSTILTSRGGLDIGTSSGGDASVGNQLIVSNGASVSIGGNLDIGLNASDAQNRLLITGAGSLVTNAGFFRFDSGDFGELIITNGGRMVNGIAYLGFAAGSDSNMVTVAGAGSEWISTATVNIGSNVTTSGSAHILLLDNGTMQANTTITTGFSGSGTLSNRGGVLQFSSATPNINTNTIDSIISTNGTISFKGVTAANINTATLSRITYQGENTFQLNNSTGSLLSAYTFGTNNGANFQHLNLVNGGTRWQATNTTLNAGGLMTFSNTTATIFGTMTNNAGTIRISATNSVSSVVTFEKSLVISGTGDGNGAIQNLRATNSIDAPITLMGSSTISSAGGKLTVLGAITNGGNTLTVGGAGNVTLASQISGTGGLAINGGGTVTISNSSANTFTGATTITNSTVRLSAASALASTSGITLSASGTLLLDGGAIDRIGNTVGITMQGGSITGNNKTETAGTLTLTANSTITLSYDGSAGDLTFANGSYTAGTLTIDNWWTGTPTEWYGDRNVDDRIYFTNDPGSTFLANVTFTGFAPGAKLLGTGELIPSSLPEPGTVIVSAFLSLLGCTHFVLRGRSKQGRK